MLAKIAGGQWSKASFCPPGGRSYHPMRVWRHVKTIDSPVLQCPHTNVHQSANQIHFRERGVLNIHEQSLRRSRIRWQTSALSCTSDVSLWGSPVLSNLPDLHLEENPTQSVSFRSLLNRNGRHKAAEAHVLVVSVCYLYVCLRVALRADSRWVWRFVLVCFELTVTHAGHIF